MPRMFYCLRAALAAVIIGLGASAPAKAASWLEKSFYMFGPDYSGVLPECDAALGTIALRFAEKESDSGIPPCRSSVSTRCGKSPSGPGRPDTIPRRFCRAVALISDGSKHAVNYWIGEDTGSIGQTWGVEWCVVGLDRNWAYNPRCKMALP